MGKDLILGMSAVFLLWVAAGAWASSRLVWRNFSLYRNWPHEERDTRVKMALWLAIPMILVAIEVQRTNGVYATVFGYWPSEFGQNVTICYLGLVLNALALALWWAFDRTYGPRRGDILWCHLMWGGLCLGALVSVFNWTTRAPMQVPWHLLAAAPIVVVVAAFFLMIVRGR